VDASADELIRRLTQRMLRKKLYVILSKGGATAEQIGAVLPKHLEYMIGLEKAGVLFASGPLSAIPGAPAGDGLTIVRAASIEEAREIASADPFVINKLRTFEVRDDLPCLPRAECVGLDDRERAVTGHFESVPSSVSEEFAHDVAPRQHPDDASVAYHGDAVDILVGHHR